VQHQDGRSEDLAARRTSSGVTQRRECEGTLIVVAWSWVAGSLSTKPMRIRDTTLYEAALKAANEDQLRTVISKWNAGKLSDKEEQDYRAYFESEGHKQLMAAITDGIVPAVPAPH
jgi:hypothetical protein